MHSEPGGQPEGSDIGVGPALSRFKYGGDRRLGPLLARRLAKAVLDDPTFDGVDVITHVPSARRAAYEPACELAFFAAKCLRKRFLPHLVVRRRTLVPQKDIFGIDDKRRNVAGAFRVCRPDLVHGRKVLLLDDVFDSGATLAEVTRELRAAGAAQVFVATVTKTRYLQEEE
jgi:predicted amidophosphoribosyltransferase